MFINYIITKNVNTCTKCFFPIEQNTGKWNKKLGIFFFIFSGILSTSTLSIIIWHYKQMVLRSISRNCIRNKWRTCRYILSRRRTFWERCLEARAQFSHPGRLQAGVDWATKYWKRGQIKLGRLQDWADCAAEDLKLGQAEPLQIASWGKLSPWPIACWGRLSLSRLQAGANKAREDWKLGQTELW